MIDTSAIDRYTNGLLGDSPSPKFNSVSSSGKKLVSSSLYSSVCSGVRLSGSVESSQLLGVAEGRSGRRSSSSKSRIVVLYINI